MNSVTIVKPDDTTLSVPLLDGSQIELTLMGEKKVVVHTALTENVTIPISSYIVVNGEKFWIVKTADIIKNNSRNYQYTITFLSLSDKLRYIMFTEQSNDKTNRRVTFTATMRPIEFLRQIVISIEQSLGIEVGIGICKADDVEQYITFSKTNINDAMNQIADAYGTEWQIRFEKGTYYIDLGPIEYDKENQLMLKYGKGNGILGGLSVRSGDKQQLKRLYVQGGERNIDYKSYLPNIRVSDIEIRKSNNLIMPYKTWIDDPTDPHSGIFQSVSIQFDGNFFGSFDYIRSCRLWFPPEGGNPGVESYTPKVFRYPADNGFEQSKALTYSISKDGQYIERDNPGEGVFAEDSYENTDIYPSLETEVDICEIQEGTGDDLGVFTVYHKLRELATAKEDKTFVVLDCIKNGENYELVPNGLAHHSNDISGYISLGYHSFTAGERIEVIQSIKLLSANTFVNGQRLNYIFYAARLIDNNTIYNYGRYGSRGDDKLLDDGKVVAVVVSTALGSGPYTFNYDLFSTDSDVRVETQKENFPNYQECIIPGEIPSIVFQSGMLAGKEFKLRTTQDGDLDNGIESTIESNNIVGFAFVKKSGDNYTKTYQNGKLAITEETTHVAFVMLREEIDNIIMAENIGGFTAKENDRFAVFNVEMPYQYLADAEVKLLKSAVKYMYENENEEFELNAEIDELYVLNNKELIQEKLRLGEYVSNEDFNISDCRIVSITRSLLNDEKISVVFSSGRKRESLGSVIKRKL